jgi:hypothetical protein
MGMNISESNVDTLFDMKFDLARCENLSNGTALKFYPCVLQIGLSLQSTDIIGVGLGLLIRKIVDVQADATNFTLGDLHKRLMCMLIKPTEHYQSYNLIVEDAIFSVLEVKILLRHAASYLLIDGANIVLDETASLKHAKLEKCATEYRDLSIPLHFTL